MKTSFLFLIRIALIMESCGNEHLSSTEKHTFTYVPASHSKVDFANTIVENNSINVVNLIFLNAAVNRSKMLEVIALGVALITGLWVREDSAKIRQVDKTFLPQLTEEERNKKYSGWQYAVERTKTTNKELKGKVC